MDAIKVEGLGKQVIEMLELRAFANNRSLDDEARVILSEAAMEGIPARPDTPSWILIRQDRVRGHKPEFGY